MQATAGESAKDGVRATPSDALRALAAHIPGDRRRALATGAAMPDRVRGAALLADISGFTALTEALAAELGPQRGAEELTANLNRVFDALIAELDRFGGHVIYFSGDALTAWINGDDGTHAIACAMAMQRAIQRFGDILTPAGSQVRLAMKAAIAAGVARRFVVGDPDIQIIDVLAGRLMDALAAAESLAHRGEVVLDSSVLDALGDRVVTSEVRAGANVSTKVGVVERLTVDVVDRPLEGEDPALPEAAVKPWLQPPVYERLRTGRDEFVAELRPAYPMFVRFGGIDYDHDENAILKLDAFVRSAQAILATYGGTLLNLTLGDKGAYLSAVFGPPLAHEDDATRCAAAALELRNLESRTAVTGIAIGLAYGRLRSGICGHRMRRTFTCIGDAVNLSARLMASAPAGSIYVSDAMRRAAGEQYTWEALPPLSVKGKQAPVAVFALTGSKRHGLRERRTSELPLVGREAEIAAIGARLEAALTGRGQIVGLCAEAGMGKSRLINEFIATARQRGAIVASGECQSYGTNSSYFAWRTVWSTLFRLDESQPEAVQLRAIESELGGIDRSFLARVPLLRDVLDLPIPDNELTRSFDAKLRKTSLESLLAACFRARAAESPLLVVLEDCHWLDVLSRDLLGVIGRSAADVPALLLLAYRPGAVARSDGIEQLPHFREIALTELDAAHAGTLIRAKVRDALGADAKASPALVELVAARAQGNPFYIEELINFVRSQGVDPGDERALRQVELPESLHSLILSRIDQLDEAPRETLKVASVVGRAFRAASLPGVYPALGTTEEVESHLTALSASDLVKLDLESDRSYLFKHVVTQEVAYESIPFAFRAALHESFGAYLEASEPIERNLDLLAYHYWRGGDLSKKREYLERAGDAAQVAYANAAAIDYFERLAPLLERSERVEVLLKLGKVHELVGNWQSAEKVLNEALMLADQLGDDHSRGWCEAALAEIARRQGRYDAATGFLGRAAHRFEALREEAGVGRVLHLAGTLAAQRGDYAKARENYEASLAIRERLGDKSAMGSVLSNLGIIAEYRGDNAASREFHERALALRTEIGDRWAIGNSTNNLGMIALLQSHFEEACSWFSKSMQLSREVGEPWMVAICHNNLGNAMRGLRDYDVARRHYADSLRAYRDYDDRWALAFLLEDVGILAALDNDAHLALELVGAADSLREAIGAARAPSREEEIATQLAPAVAMLSALEQQACRARGRALDLAAAIATVLRFCDPSDNSPDAQAAPRV
jgi:class 3 adenylate cyclase/tetratricopeptide (TPR) repeat protein